MKKIVLFLFVLVILCGFSSVSSNAAEKGGEVKRCTETVYKGQKRLLLYSDEDGIARIDEDAWTIKSGKKNIKLCDGGKYIKGLKVGKAVLTANISGTQVEMTVNVVKTPKLKQRSVKLGKQSFVVPKDYEVKYKDDQALICKSIKDTTYAGVVKKENWIGLSTEELGQSLHESGSYTVLSSLYEFKIQGYEFEDGNLSISDEGGFICLKQDLDYPDVDLFMYYCAIITDDMVYEAYIESYDKNSLKNLVDELMSANNTSLIAGDNVKDKVSDNTKTGNKEGTNDSVVVSGSGKGDKTISLKGKLKYGVPYRFSLDTESNNLCRAVGDYDDGNTKSYAVNGYGKTHYEGLLQEETFLFSILYKDIKVTSLNITSNADTEWEYRIEEIKKTSDKKIKGSGERVTDIIRVKSGDMNIDFNGKEKYDFISVKVYSAAGKLLGTTSLNDDESSLGINVQTKDKDGIDVFFVISAPDNVKWEISAVK